ncbi:TPA: DUF2164 family protein [Candidatus Saccharibacteria bacterium]|nr:DUF2164 family protein [Candidatus Saccharibacteria bacterium]HIO87819.1 DUF2164 family protein [Candidatus Saccharibacteria bacterium]
MKKPKKPAYDFLSKEDKKILIDKIVEFFKKEYDLELGVIAADEILEITHKDIALNAYNQSLKITQRQIEQKLEDLQIEFDLLQKRAS